MQIALYFVALVVASAALAPWLRRVFPDVAAPEVSGTRGWLVRAFGGDVVRTEQSWFRYALALLIFNIVGILALYAILRFQAWLPWNPRAFAGLSPDLAFNTAVSFVTNTNWQAYSGEASLSYFSQMVGLTVPNFLSAATGIAVALALTRAIARERAATLGNFYADVTRGTLALLLPISLLIAVLLVWQGVPQTLSDYPVAHTLEGARQTLATGPVASQIAIKQLGTNGGGFFGVNSAHPFENATAISNFIEALAILAIPGALLLAFGRWVGDRRHARALYATVLILFLIGVLVAYAGERWPNPLFDASLVDSSAGAMEGKEIRFGVEASALWSVITTVASCGAVNAMHDSFNPLGGLVQLLNMMTGEVIFGGVGAGLYGLLLYVLLAVFLAGLMVGRTPEYLGKKIETREMLLVVLALLSVPVGILGLGGLAAVLPAGVSSAQDPGPHGFTELLYTYTSATANNGSAFGGFTANTPFHNTMTGIAMLIGRFGMILPLLALAGSLASKPRLAPTAGTFPTHGVLFVVLLLCVITIFGALTFFPALALGPLAEHFAMLAGKAY
jgi:potassium-transporting ATPase potassium-binding subunit